MSSKLGLGGFRCHKCRKSCRPVITSIGLDHTDVLGDNLASIASEKAGIIRTGVPVVVGQMPHEAMRIVRSPVSEAPCLGIDFTCSQTKTTLEWG